MQPRRKKSHLLLTAQVSRGDFDLALGLLYQCGLASSQTIKGRGRIGLSAALPPGLAAKSLLSRLKVLERGLGRPLFHEAKIQKVLRGDWSRKYQSYLNPFRLIPPVGPDFPGLEIDPRGKLPRRLEKNTLYIEAGLAFGTGTHATTRLAAELLSEAMASRRRPAVLDVGCGTGILAMAAKRLGAGKVAAVDNDPEALVTAKDNFKRNRISGIRLLLSHKGLKSKFPVIVSNIGLNVILELKAEFARLLAAKGDLILTGLLYRDVAELLRAYRGMEFVGRRNRSGWAAVWLRKRG
ncbi:MAG TPA: 50S ribosomal protein L11 methyltransferase [bacterium]|nr:50S ribosomal protein L11 methyltransferase [bacterium]